MCLIGFVCCLEFMVVLICYLITYRLTGFCSTWIFFCSWLIISYYIYYLCFILCIIIIYSFIPMALFQISSALVKFTLSTCTYLTIILLVTIIDWIVIYFDSCYNWLILYWWMSWNSCNLNIFLNKDIAYIGKTRIFELADLFELSSSYWICCLGQ